MTGGGAKVGVGSGVGVKVGGGAVLTGLGVAEGTGDGVAVSSRTGGGATETSPAQATAANVSMSINAISLVIIGFDRGAIPISCALDKSRIRVNRAEASWATHIVYVSTRAMNRRFGLVQ
jgi:hypothetical protein